MVAGAYEHTINMQAQKQALIAFVQMGRVPQISVGISTAKAASYKSPKDLKGLKIGVSAPGLQHQHPLQLLHLPRRVEAERRRRSSASEPAPAGSPR